MTCIDFFTITENAWNLITFGGIIYITNRPVSGDWGHIFMGSTFLCNCDSVNVNNWENFYQKVSYFSTSERLVINLPSPKS